MESNWRWNVYAQGWGESEIALLARIHRDDRVLWIASTPDGPTNSAYLETLAPGQDPVIIGRNDLPGHFPYGIDVLPDDPT